jgi:hypothetical protein
MDTKVPTRVVMENGSDHKINAMVPSRAHGIGTHDNHKYSLHCEIDPLVQG